MKRLLVGIIGGIILVHPSFSIADELPSKLMLKTDFKLWEVNLTREDLFSDYQTVTFHGLKIDLPTSETSETLQLEKSTQRGLDLIKIQNWLRTDIAPDIDRPREDVTIDMDEKGKIIFEGHGLYGRTLDTETAALLIKRAIESGIDYVHLPILKEDPVISLKNPALSDMGITELVSAGETDYTGSPRNRVNNIRVGLARFNGHLIKPGEEFVFGKVLGPVDQSTGYLPELVIKGDRTIPEYGGGLCQVSTTAYRAMLSGGFPITMRRNHSFAVSYYSPIGLDATVYPPSVDLKFVNDSPAHLLMQSFTIGGKAYYNFYGTKDARKVVMIGPYYSNFRSPPPPKTEYTTDLAPGEKQKLGSAVPGITANWYRHVSYLEQPKEAFMDHIYSNYQARPLFYAEGVASPQDATAQSQLQSGF